MDIKNNKKLKKSDLSITVLLVVGIVLVVNFFSYQMFFRWDLTDNDIFSISDVSKKAVRELDDIVHIKAYFSSNLPSQILSLKQETSDILSEYEAYSNGKIRVEYINPGDDESMKRELYLAGIPQLTFQVYEKDRVQTVNGYFGIAVSYGDKTEVIPTIKKEASGLEYQLTTAIKKVISEHISTIGYVTSNGTADIEKEVSTGFKALQELYTVQQVDLSEGKDIPVNINTLIVLGPKESFDDEQILKIGSFVDNGGSLLVFADGVVVGQGLVAQKGDASINKLFEKYGLSLEQNLVADNRSGMASFSQGFMTFSTPYPFWPKVTKSGFNQNETSVSSLESVVLPWASSVSIKNAQDDKTYAKLVYTTDKAWSISDNFNIAPNGITTPTSGRSEYVLAMSVAGKADFNNTESDNQFKGKLIMVGDSDFISDSFLRQNPDNLTFFQNLVDSVSLDDDLISIRSKVISSRPLDDKLSDGSKSALRYLNIFGVTVIVLLFGTGRYYFRRKSKFIDEI